MRPQLLLCGSLALVAAGSAPVAGQHGMPGGHPMTFFVTSEPIGDGGNLGGLAGADAHCRTLATAVGAGGKTWRAYLSTQARPGQPAVNARDRIGTGPWYNFDGVMVASSLAHLHGDTIELARKGNNLTKRTGLTEKGQIVPGLNDYQVPRDSDWEYSKTTLHTNRHEMLTGSQLDGRAYPPGEDNTCDNWTSNKDAPPGAPSRAGSRPGTSERANRLPGSQRRRERLVEFIARDPGMQPDGAQPDARRRHVLLLRDRLRNTCER